MTLLRLSRSTVIVGTLVGLLIGLPAPSSAQEPATPTLRLSLNDALRRGLRDGEEVRLATERVEMAQEQIAATRASLYPQVDGRINYQRTIRSPIGGGSFTFPDSLQWSPDSLASTADRLRYIEQRTPAAGLGALGALFSDLPFGQKHTYVASLGFTQTLFDPGVFTGLSIAREFGRMAEADASEERLNVALSIIEAYYAAILADQMSQIVAASATQLQAQVEQVRLVFAAGNASELDVLRVEVDLQNIEPSRVEALNLRDVALLNLRRVINLPIGQPVLLTDTLVAAQFQPIPSAELDRLTSGALSRRQLLQARERERVIRERQVTLARGASLPTISLSANIGTQALPGDPLPMASEFRDDWNAGVSVRVPIFSGGRRQAQVEQARVQLRTTELQIAQLREGISLEVAQRRGELERAAALIRAREQTVAQAARAYQLTDLSYQRGLQTALQLGDARLQLQRARGNEAQALHDYYVALARLLRASGSAETDFVGSSGTGVFR